MVESGDIVEDKLLKGGTFVAQEHHLDGHDVDMAPHDGREVVDEHQAGGIFLRRDDEALAALEGGEGLFDALYVVGLELMMVGEAQGRDVARHPSQVHQHLLRRSDAGKQQHVSVGRELLRLAGRLAKEVAQGTIAERREEQVLVRLKPERFLDDAVVHGLHLGRALRHDDNVRTLFGAHGFAQASGRQELVVGDEAVVVGKQDVEARFDVAVLESIVEENDVGVARGLERQQLAYAMAAVGVHGDDGFGKFLLHLPGLIANLAHRGSGHSQPEAAALAFIAAAEHSNAMARHQHT